MSPEHRFHSYITSATVMVMYFVIQHAVPLLNVDPSIAVYLKPLGTLLVSVGIYKFLATLLLASSRKIKFVKRHLLGPNYLNGTWVGKFQTSESSIVYSVEHFEQTLSSLKVRGQAFSVADESYAYWNSLSETIDAEVGVLTYTYNCDKNDDKGSFQGVCVFQLERSDATSAAQRMRGYSADLIDGQRTENRETKLSEDLIPFAQALEMAMQL